MATAPIMSAPIPDGEWPDWPLNPAWIRSGNPTARGTVTTQSADRRVTAGMWSVEPGSFDFIFPWDEFIHILDGEAEVTDVATGETIPVRAGWMAHFELGTRTRWNVTRKIRKYYVIRTPEPFVR
jgi:uncharacterized cupin superfamily protein